jgi:hypothetical protein
MTVSRYTYQQRPKAPEPSPELPPPPSRRLPTPLEPQHYHHHHHYYYYYPVTGQTDFYDYGDLEDLIYPW